MHRFTILLFFFGLFTLSAGKDCLLVEEVGWFEPSNVFTCPDTPEDQTCCPEYGKPKCCKKPDVTRNIIEQVKLWGSVLCVVLLIFVGMYLCKKECNPCDGSNVDTERTCCCCKRKKKNVDKKQLIPKHIDNHLGTIDEKHGGPPV